MPSFTDLSIQKLPEGVHFDGKLPSFGIRVGKNRRTWLVIKGHNRTKVSLGHYPALSLQDARKKAMATLAAPAQKTSQIAFSDAKDAFLALDRWRPQSKRVLTSNLRHFQWKRTLDKITHEDVATVLEGIKGKSARAHALKDIRTFFNWCIPRYLSHSPCQGLKMESQPSRDRVLTHDELKRVWTAAETMDYPFGTIVRLLILTGCRKNEIGSLTWEQITDNTITIPASVSKNGREHTVPLGAWSRTFIDELFKKQSKPTTPSGFLFLAPSQRAEKYNGYTFHLKELQKISETSNWTLHDLRRTYATNLAALGTPIHITERLLNHVSGSLSGVAGIYNRYSYLDEMREACTRYEEFIKSLVSGPS